MKEPKTISILGGRGKMGSLFAEAFRQQNYRVLVSDEYSSDNQELARYGEIVIVSVPIEKTVEVIKEIGPFIQKDSLLTDFTSVKIKPVEAMASYSQAQVLGGHPLFGPDIEQLYNQHMVLCPARGEDYLPWYSKMLEKLGLKVTVMSAEEHDRSMAIVQCLTHFSNLVFASALSAIDPEQVMQETTTPSYALRRQAMAQMFSQNPSLYAGIFTENPFAAAAVRAYREAAAEISYLVQGSNKEGLEKLLVSLKKKAYAEPAEEKNGEDRR